MDIGENRFNGTIPDSFRQLGKLKELLLNDNKISGTVPDAFAHMAELTDLCVLS